MKVLITGICGFVGGSLARELPPQLQNLELFGIDNLSRPGSEQNRRDFKQRGIRFFHGDIRNPSDLECLPAVDWIIDTAANPSVLAGVTGGSTSRQLMEHNLLGTVNLLEVCKRHNSGLLVLSTSRVYSLAKLAFLPMDVIEYGFVPRFSTIAVQGLSEHGLNESFSTEPPVSLYGCAKIASEFLALEYAHAFGLPVHINRCGVLAGAGQFGKADQGIFSFWIHSYRQRRPLKYIGFGGSGHQVRDCLHPRDLASLIAVQMVHPEKGGRVLNVSGGKANSVSLARLSEWCSARFGAHEIASEPSPRAYDVPWLVLDSTLAENEWKWKASTSLESILVEIADHADQHPEWLNLSES